MRFVYRLLDMNEIAQFVLQTLRERSPVGSGDDPHPGLYRDSHMLFINGHNVPDAKGWKPGQELEFSNPVPYARKIELGSMKVSAPPHVYEESAPLISARYGNSVSVNFVFMPVKFGSVQAYSQSLAGQAAGGRRGGSRKARQDWLVRQPAIIIRAR
ncbi:hypothetical protein ACQR10_04565 [Bradyrhizobium sp. HKCCYLRH2060]|uniref:hypothetical protein n=1 Tax=Bradyrhizobium TaxID=374 RepID=UPI003EB902BC